MKPYKRAAAWITASTLLFSLNTIPCAAAEPLSPSVQLVSEETANFYKQWKEKYLVQNSYVTDEAQYYIWYSETSYTGGDPVAVTVSEAHGYGMLTQKQRISLTACIVITEHI